MLNSLSFPDCHPAAKIGGSAAAQRRSERNIFARRRWHFPGRVLKFRQLLSLPYAGDRKMKAGSSSRSDTSSSHLSPRGCIRTMRDEGMPVHAGRLAAILHPRWPDMLVPRSQIEQTAEGASTLVLVFEAPSIELGSQASGPAYVVRQRRASGRVSCLGSFPLFEHYKPEQTAKHGVASVLRGAIGRSL